MFTVPSQLFVYSRKKDLKKTGICLDVQEYLYI